LIFFFSEGLVLLVVELSRIVEVIKEEYDPERIIVFGSMAGNNIHEWSDIDLLVVKRTSKRPLERVLELGRLVKPKVGIEEFRG
jgi:uncharacterized protein